MTIVISLIGHERVGKNFIAAQLKSRFETEGFKVLEFANADALKNLTQNIIKCDRDTLEEMKASNEVVELLGKDYTIRDLLISVSEDWIKPVFGQNVWADFFKKIVDSSEHDIIIKTDDRYPADLTANPEMTVYVAIRNPFIVGIETTPYHAHVVDMIERADVTYDNVLAINTDQARFEENMKTLINDIWYQYSRIRNENEFIRSLQSMVESKGKYGNEFIKNMQ